MAPFEKGRHDRGPSTLDWRLLQNSPVALYLRPVYMEEDAAELEELGYVLRPFQCSTWTSNEAMYSDLKAGFGFPRYGENLNALRDVLTDIEVPDVGAMAVLLRAIDSEIDRVEPVIEALADTARHWLLFGRRFLVLAQTRNSNYRGPADLGATRAVWNPREWRDDARS